MLNLEQFYKVARSMRFFCFIETLILGIKKVKYFLNNFFKFFFRLNYKKTHQIFFFCLKKIKY